MNDATSERTTAGPDGRMARIVDDYVQRARRRAWVEFLGPEEASVRVFAGAAGSVFHTVATRAWSPRDARVRSDDLEPCIDVCEKWADAKRCFEVLDALDDCQDLLSAGNLLEAYARLSALHREEPERFEIQELLLDVLFGLGLDENDFRWSQRPRIVRLDRTTRDRILLHLMRCGPKDVHLLRFELFHREYLCFDEETLAAHLRLDPRFDVSEQDWSPEPGWRARRVMLSAVPEC